MAATAVFEVSGTYTKLQSIETAKMHCEDIKEVKVSDHFESFMCVLVDVCHNLHII